MLPIVDAKYCRSSIVDARISPYITWTILKLQMVFLLGVEGKVKKRLLL
jgi:hypothetical protein